MSGVVAGAVIGGIIGGGSSLNSISKQNKQKTKAFLKQMEYLQRNYNYNQAALDRQERSRYDSALVDLFTMSLNSYQNNSQLEAALAETGTEGRSSEKIMQTVRGQTARQVTSYKEAYLNDVWNIRGQKEALYISTKAEVEQAKDQLSASYIHAQRKTSPNSSTDVQTGNIGASCKSEKSGNVTWRSCIHACTGFPIHCVETSSRFPLKAS